MTLSLPWFFQTSDSQRPEKEADNEEKHPTAALTALLSSYKPGILPPSSRVDLQLKQREWKPLGLLDLWKYGAFVAHKATNLAGDFISHHIFGPRRPSWGIEMTIITSLMRNSQRHCHLTDIVTLRSLTEISGMVPLPSDALVTPLTFRVKKRNLRGILAEFDDQEDGSRIIPAEWVVGKRLWQKLQNEWKSSKQGQKKAFKSKQRIVLYLHGGAYYVFSAATHRLITIPLSKYTDARVFAIDYRLAPETRFPGPLHDAVSAYLRLIEDLAIPPENILVAGDSAGGGLTLALLMYLRDNQYPLPSGAIVMSPWVDLTMSCDSWDSNAPFDVIPMPDIDDHLNPISCYLGAEGMDKFITHPYASPLFGDFTGLPPLLVQAGDAEVLRDESTLLAHKATLAGVDVRHELYEDAVHVFQMFPFLEAARKSFLSCRDFVRSILPLNDVEQLNETARAGLEKEIGNENSQVVRGDGVEVATGKMASKELADEERGSDSDSGEDPSWGYRPDITTQAPQDEMGPAIVFPTTDPEPHQLLTPEPSPVLRRSHTASSPIAPRGSRNLFHFASLSRATAPNLATSPRVKLAPLMMASSTAQPATPMVRSRNRALSHPDMADLCRSWAESGPANTTVTYRPDSSSSSLHSPPA